MIDLYGKNINVLVVSKSSWVTNNAFGNTLSNFFGNSDKLNLYSVYLREQLPDNGICFDYYNITDNQLVKNIITPWNIGDIMSSNDIENKRKSKLKSKSVKAEAKIINISKRYFSSFLRISQEILWLIGGWRNKKFNDYLIERNIDIIFAPAAGPIYLQLVINYCRKVTNAKLVLFFADDTYTHKTIAPISFIYQIFFRKSLRKTINVSTKFYGASQKLCDEYKMYFGKDIKPLYKGCYFDKHKKINSVFLPVKIIYAGNLYYGRDKILAKLADEIVRINRNSQKLQLEIYTTTAITSEIIRNLNRGESSKIMGSLPYEEIKKVLTNADIVLHVESFDTNQIKTTRLSFSTKIIDCMQSGSCMMAIGPDSIASIDYLLRIDGVIVVTDPLKIGYELEKVAYNPDSLKLKAQKLAKFARENHDIYKMRYELQNDLLELCSEERKK